MEVGNKCKISAQYLKKSCEVGMVCEYHKSDHFPWPLKANNYKQYSHYEWKYFD